MFGSFSFRSSSSFDLVLTFVLVLLIVFWRDLVIFLLFFIFVVVIFGDLPLEEEVIREKFGFGPTSVGNLIVFSLVNPQSRGTLFLLCCVGWGEVL